MHAEHFPQCRAQWEFPTNTTSHFLSLLLQFCTLLYLFDVSFPAGLGTVYGRKSTIFIFVSLACGMGLVVKRLVGLPDEVQDASQFKSQIKKEYIFNVGMSKILHDTYFSKNPRYYTGDISSGGLYLLHPVTLTGFTIFPAAMPTFFRTGFMKDS